MTSARRLIATVSCGLLALAACSGGSKSASPASTTAPSATGSTTTTTALQLGPGQVLHHVGSRFQYGAMLITIGDLVYDPATTTAFVGVRYQNLSHSWHDVLPLANIDEGGTTSPGIGDTATLPPGMTIDMTVEFSSLASDPAQSATLTWGSGDKTLPKVNLASGAVTDGALPVEVPITGWARIGRYSVHVTGGSLQSGVTDLDLQASSGERVLRVRFDEYAASQDPVNGFYPIEHLTLKRPDDTTVEGQASSDGVAPVSWTTTTGNWIDFLVPDPPAGDYQLLLSSVSPKAMSTFFPDKIERAPLAFHLDAPAATPATPVAHPPVPVLQKQAAAAGFTQAIDAGSMNVPGFSVKPTKLTFDPAALSAKLDVDVTSFEPSDAGTADGSSAAGQAGGLLETDPSFSFSELLASGGRSYNGIISGDVTVKRGTTKSLTIEFLSVDHLSAADAGLFIGAHSSIASSLPLGPNSSAPAYPPAPQQQNITADPATAGDWTVKLRSYRVGLFLTATPPPPGERDLEVAMDVTAAPTAVVKALGLSFRGSVQVFLASSDGYLVQAVNDNELVQYTPGATHLVRVTFHVPESFRSGAYRLVLRSTDETADVTADSWVETSFSATLGTQAAPSLAADGSVA